MNSKPVPEVDDRDVERFLTWLAVHRNVVSTTQDQAFNALLFLFRHILKRPYELGDRVKRARRTRYVPVVLSRPEVDDILNRMEDPFLLIAQLLYGCGLRLTETLRLRVGQLNLAHRTLTIHRGKGRKDRAVMLPQCLIEKLERHLLKIRAQFEQDLEAGFGGSFAPEGSPAKWESRCTQWPWQFVFPAKTLTLVPESGKRKRYHVHGSHFSKSLRHAVWKSGISKKVGAHTLRHTFASHLILANVDIRTIQEMMGHADVKTTMIYTQTVPSRTWKERKSPLDMDPEDISTEGVRSAVVGGSALIQPRGQLRIQRILIPCLSKQHPIFSLSAAPRLIPTQNQALNVIVFLYQDVLKQDVVDFSIFPRARRRK